MAGIHDEILALPGGYETDSGERAEARRQRQRIVIARALGRRLSCSTSRPVRWTSIEARIQETLTGLKGKVMLLIVAHRLSTLSICDRVMILKDGAIGSFAPGAELAKTDAYYSDALRLARRGLHDASPGRGGPGSRHHASISLLETLPVGARCRERPRAGLLHRIQAFGRRAADSRGEGCSPRAQANVRSFRRGRKPERARRPRGPQARL